MTVIHEPAIFYPFRRRYSDRIRDLEAIGMPENVRRLDQVRWLKGLDIAADDIAWLLGINYHTVLHYLSQASASPPHRAAQRDRVWKHVLPAHVAKAQALNERDRAMLRAHQAGATYREIATRVGIWPQQVGTQMKKAQRRMREGRLTPIEEYFMDWGDLGALSEMPARTHMGQRVCPTCGQPLGEKP